MNRRERKKWSKQLRIPVNTLPVDVNPMVKEYKVGRNDPCPCGAGKDYEMDDGLIYSIRNKYKNCCLPTGKYENYKTN